MYSALWKFLSLWVGMAVFVLAGAALHSYGPRQGFVVMAVIGAVCLASFGRECRLQGSLPLRSLKPGRQYRVEAVLPEQRGFRRERTARLVLSWHEDYGHYEYRLAYLDRSRLDGTPVAGDTIIGHSMEYEGGMSYSVRPAQIA